MPDWIWIQTYTGRRFQLDNPRISDVAIEDIAHSLAMQCRFGGHTRRHYSVAQHCVLASQVVEPRFALDALLHDAAEAYTTDVPTPMKRAIGVAWSEREERIARCVTVAFGVRWPIPDAVHHADLTLLATEARDLLWGGPIGGWTNELPIALDDPISPWSADLAEHRFLERFHQLRGRHTAHSQPYRDLAGASAELSPRERGL